MRSCLLLFYHQLFAHMHTHSVIHTTRFSGKPFYLERCICVQLANMVATRAVKRAVADSQNPLMHKGILQLVLDLVGPGEHLFVALVSTLFKECNISVKASDGVELHEHFEESFTLLPQMTCCQAIVGSLSRLQFALDYGYSLNVNAWEVQLMAGWHADTVVLTALHNDHAMPYSATVSRGAACSGTVSKLQWLLDEQNCEQADDICNYAAFADSTDMLEYLKQQRGLGFTANTCFNAARGVYHVREKLHYLHAAAAPWDHRTLTAAVSTGDLPLLQWLHAKGCPMQAAAAAVAAAAGSVDKLSWLLANGCPHDWKVLLVSAAKSGSMAVLEWIKSSGAADWSATGLAPALNAAAANSELVAAQVLLHARLHFMLHSIYVTIYCSSLQLVLLPTQAVHAHCTS
jgi:hypothetical protein